MRRARKISKERFEILNENPKDVKSCEPLEEVITNEEINELNDIELEKISKANLFDKFYNFIIIISNISLKVCKFLIKTSGIYVLWIGLHYFSAQLYIKFCVPSTLFGFIMSPFLVSTPHCQGLRWIVYNAANIINNMWILIGAWIYSMIWILNTDNSSDK